MGVARDRLLHFALIFLNFFFSVPVRGDWNADFLSDSIALVQTFEAFQKQGRYMALLQNFQELRVEIENDGNLIQELNQLKRSEKKNFFRQKYVVKKRIGQNVNELFFWELSILFSLDEYVTPSFPFEFSNNHIAIVQPFEKFTIGSWIETPPLSLASQVTIRDYFLAHILAFILGTDDLSGMNLGITPKKNIRFFDNEAIFAWDLQPRRNPLSFYLTFVSVSFDYPQYRKKIDAQLAEEITDFVAALAEKKEELLIYAKIRNLPDSVVFEILNRIELLQCFDFTSNIAFVDFVYFVYPQIAEGLDELNNIVSNILRRKVDHGISLFFATRMIRYWHLSTENKQKLKAWVERYVE